MKTLPTAVAGAVLALAAFQVHAEAVRGERQVSLRIEANTLAEALDLWAQQTGFQILVPNWEMTKKISVPPLRGRYKAREALDRLLEGTPLMGVWTTEKSVTIREKVAPIVWQATPAQPPAVQKLVGDGLEGAGAQVAAVAAPAVQPRPGDDALRRSELEEIIVTGTHIRGVHDSASALITIDRARIASTGLGTATRLMESLPQNFSLASQSGVFVPGVSDTRTQGSSINLRGLGEGTTLVLLNGRRMAAGYIGAAVDIASLPLSAVERVEIMTDGASALYGSDAVGGVVNFVLRRDFNGAETRLRSGWADGVDELRISQAIGRSWDSGHAAISAEYYSRDLLSASDRSFVPGGPSLGSLLPRDKNRSVMLSAEQEAGDAVSFFADTLYTYRDTYNESGEIALSENYASTNPQTNATAGVTWRLPREWQLEVFGTHARNKLDQTQRSADAPLEFDTRFVVRGGQAIADGPLMSIGGGSVRAALGVEWRSEALSFSTSGGQSGEEKQTVRSAFGEINIPVVGSGHPKPGITSLGLSLAGRYDEYSSFGSSFDPRYGLTWQPMNGVRLRGSYGTSYVAPKLLDYYLGSNFAFAATLPDPESASGESHQLHVGGVRREGLSAQEARGTSFGIELSPGLVPGLAIGVGYYDIDYRSRIAAPQVAEVMLAEPASFGGLIVRSPSIDRVEEFIGYGELGQGFIAFNPDFSFPNPDFAADSIDVIVDLRRRNLSVTKTRGMDLSVEYGFASAHGDVQLGLSGTYVLELVQQITSTSAAFDTVDTFYNPPDYRVRGFLGWQRRGWSFNCFVNYTDSYTDNRTTLPARVAAYTTVDARLAYELGQRFPAGALSDLTISLSAENLFDEDPPRTAVLASFSDLGFDPTNANPMGRLIAIELVKAW